jgi:predicted DNA binding CopG/RHH family protein
MPIEKRILPDFQSEAEEAKWWIDHQDEILIDFERAAEDGTLLRGAAARVKAIPTTTIRLDPVDIQLAREQAEKRGLKYQTYLKMLIHEALTRESEARESKAS